MNEVHPVDQFFGWVDDIPHAHYPDELVPVAGRHVDGVAGFPAGRGLYADCGWDHTTPPLFPYGGLMLVGNHLDAEDVYVEKLRRGEANGDPCPGAPRMRFWSMLYALLDLAGIDRDRIFVTNVHPALIRGRTPTGAVRRASQAWLDTCASLLARQIEVMRPTAVAAMGRPAQGFMAQMYGIEWAGVPDEVTVESRRQGLPLLAIKHPSAAQSLAKREETAALLRRVMRQASGEGVRSPDSGDDRFTGIESRREITARHRWGFEGEGDSQ